VAKYCVIWSSVFCTAPFEEGRLSPRRVYRTLLRHFMHRVASAMPAVRG